MTGFLFGWYILGVASALVVEFRRKRPGALIRVLLWGLGGVITFLVVIKHMSNE